MTKCLVCGSNITSTKKIEGYQAENYFEIDYCKSCNTSMATPAIINEDLYNTIYKNISKIDGYERYYRISRDIKKEKEPMDYLARQDAMYWAVNEFISTYPNIESAKILEVGCGFGYLTYALKAKNLNIKGIDISSEAVKNATANYGNLYEEADVFTYCKEFPKNFDIIILTEVIEHITDVIPFLNSLMSMIKEDGKLLITTPNKSAFILDSIWDTELPPIHFWWFSENSFIKISEKLNIKCNFLDFSKFNRKYTDFTQSILYKPFDRSPIISKNNTLIHQSSEQKYSIKKTIKSYLISSGILRYRILRRTGYNEKISNTLCVILQN